MTATTVTSEAVEAALDALPCDCTAARTDGAEEHDGECSTYVGEDAMRAALEAALPLLIPEPKGYVVLGYEGCEYPTLDCAGMWKTPAEAETDKAAAEHFANDGERFTIAAVVELPEPRDIAETAVLPDDESGAGR